LAIIDEIEIEMTHVQLDSYANRCCPPVAATFDIPRKNIDAWRAGPGCGAHPDGQQMP